MIVDALLGGMSEQEFLDGYWQKKPLMVRGALPGFVSPLTPEELAGLACEPDVESRLVVEAGGDYPWQLRHGPFDEDDFLALPETQWSLLVQEVDHLVPEVAALIEHFRFIPAWRIDDVMVSYAPAAGGVGAHVDNYDVFLIQGLGRRRWQIGDAPVWDEVLVPNLDVRILDDFVPAQEWILEPGDMLYLPPRFAHNGIALDDCMTYSVGFRAPSHEDLVAAFAEHLIETIDPLDRYADPDLKAQSHPFQISREALGKVRGIFRDLVTETEIDRWFGRYVTEPAREALTVPPDEPLVPQELVARLRDGDRLRRVPAVRCAFIQHDDGTATFFVGGDAFILGEATAWAAPVLCDAQPLSPDRLTPHLDEQAFVALLADLVNEGYLELEG